MTLSKYNIIICDPPWSFSDSLKMSDTPRGASDQYPVMSNSDIKNLKIKELAGDNAILALWVPSSLLSLGSELMKHWGFKQTQTWIWVKSKKDPLGSLKKQINNFLKPSLSDKDKKININQALDSFSLNDSLGFGMGRLFRQCHEICLIGVKGKIYPDLKNKSQRSVYFAPNWKHSAKPEGLQDRLELMFPNPDKKIEIFSRRNRNGWTCIGNEITKEDITVSIEKLL
jgi:N6-adenosine-specific RNA methylase IME4